MDRSLGAKNTIVPHTDNLLGLSATHECTLYNDKTHQHYVRYGVEYFNYCWKHIYEINVSIPESYPFKRKMLVSDLIECCSDVEIWYLGYSLRVLSFIQAPCPALAYIKGERITNTYDE